MNIKYIEMAMKRDNISSEEFEKIKTVYLEYGKRVQQYAQDVKIDNTDEERYLSENEEDLEEILDKSWNRLYDGYTPSITGISITPKEGKGMDTAAGLLQNIAYIFDTEVYYG